MNGSNETTVTINVTTADGENYAGAFKVKKKLSYRDRLRRDELRRELLGNMPAGAIDDAIIDSFGFAELMVRIIESPKWWSEKGNGLDLLDIEPVQALKAEIDKLDKAAALEKNKAVAEAKKDLAEEVK